MPNRFRRTSVVDLLAKVPVNRGSLLKSIETLLKTIESSESAVMIPTLLRDKVRVDAWELLFVAKILKASILGHSDLVEFYMNHIGHSTLGLQQQQNNNSQAATPTGSITNGIINQHSMNGDQQLSPSTPMRQLSSPLIIPSPYAPSQELHNTTTNGYSNTNGHNHNHNHNNHQHHLQQQHQPPASSSLLSSVLSSSTNSSISSVTTTTGGSGQLNSNSNSKSSGAGWITASQHQTSSSLSSGSFTSSNGSSSSTASSSSNEMTTNHQVANGQTNGTSTGTTTTSIGPNGPINHSSVTSTTAPFDVTSPLQVDSSNIAQEAMLAARPLFMRQAQPPSLLQLTTTNNHINSVASIATSFNNTTIEQLTNQLSSMPTLNGSQIASVNGGGQQQLGRQMNVAAGANGFDAGMLSISTTTANQQSASANGATNCSSTTTTTTTTTSTVNDEMGPRRHPSELRSSRSAGCLFRANSGASSPRTPGTPYPQAETLCNGQANVLNGDPNAPVKLLLQIEQLKVSIVHVTSLLESVVELYKKSIDNIAQ